MQYIVRGFPEPLPLYVMTNQAKVYGAAGFLMKEKLSRFVEEKGRSLYIIPDHVYYYDWQTDEIRIP